MKRILIVISICCVSILSKLKAQEINIDSIISLLVSDIEQEQVKEKGEFYPGTFTSFRGAITWPHNYKPDNNIFFTAIGNLTLQQLRAKLNPAHQNIIDSILSRSKKAFRFYQNKDSLPLYHFWPTGSKVLPHSFVLQHLSTILEFGEDADDTVMLLMLQENNDSINSYVKKRLLTASNMGIPTRKSWTTYKRFRDYKAYTTYFGIKMPVDFDFSVQCNVLYFNYEKKLPWNVNDSATLALITEMVKERLYMKNPIFISKYYGKSSVILYNLTRLMYAFHIPALDQYKPAIIADLKNILVKAKSPLEKVIIQTSLLRLGEHPNMLTAREMQEIRMIDQHKFSIFQARAPYFLATFLTNLTLRANMVNYNFFAPTYDKILLLENLVLRKNINPSLSFQQ